MENLIGRIVKVKGWEELGVGKITAFNNDNDYPVFVEFENKSLHHSEQTGEFELERIIFEDE